MVAFFVFFFVLFTVVLKSLVLIIACVSAGSGMYEAGWWNHFATEGSLQLVFLRLQCKMRTSWSWNYPHFYSLGIPFSFISVICCGHPSPLSTLSVTAIFIYHSQTPYTNPLSPFSFSSFAHTAIFPSNSYILYTDPPLPVFLWSLDW